MAEDTMLEKLRLATTGKLTENQFAYTKEVGCTEALIDILFKWTHHLDS